MNKEIDFTHIPIDIVYLWCDGSDPAFLRRKRQYVPADITEELGGKCRHMNNDELKYSLRSLEKYAPWIHHVYILTDNQKPSWLNLDNPKVTVVDLTEILSSEVLPTFNSEAIETSLHKIPGLSEFFLYANDDMLFGAKVTPGFFFTAEGLPIIRGDRKFLFENYLTTNAHMRNVFRASFLVWKRLGDTLLFYPHHNIDAYRKSFYEEAETLFAQEHQFVRQKRFRSKNAQFRMLVHILTYVRKKGIFKQVDCLQSSWPSQAWSLLCAFVKKSDSFSDSVEHVGKAHKWMIKAGKYRLFCLNDTHDSSDSARDALKVFLRELFPTPSSFETAL
jgi:hypothetical protein